MSTITNRLQREGTAALTVDRVYELVIRCVSDLTEHAPDYRDRCHRLLEGAGRLEEAATWIVRVLGLSRWCEALDPHEAGLAVA
ncbi:MAG: hypothetical protein GEU99_09760 [Luteitalea sp.]|nr:hypothetical protein [Luteitalea sp.]